MRLNLLSLAPDTFVLGNTEDLDQFYPKKVFNIRNFSGDPWGVEIHLTSKCQLKCPRCSYEMRNQEKTSLTPNCLKNILVSISKRDVGSVIFSGGGEPLAWELGGFDEVFLENVKYSQSIATNGLGIINSLNKKLLDRIDIVQINIGGYDKNSYLLGAGIDRFEDFCENVQWLLSNRDKKYTQVTGKIVIDNKNYTLIKEYLQFCFDIGFDLIVVKLAGNFESGQNVELNQNQKRELRDLIYESPVLNKYPAKLDAITTYDNSTELSLPKKCWVIERGLYMLIRSNGEVFLCVTSPYSSENSIGNVYNRSIDEIWNSDKHRIVKNKLHADMASCKCNLGICRHMRYNYLLDVVMHSCAYVDSLPAAKIKVRLL